MNAPRGMHDVKFTGQRMHDVECMAQQSWYVCAHRSDITSISANTMVHQSHYRLKWYSRWGRCGPQCSLQLDLFPFHMATRLTRWSCSRWYSSSANVNNHTCRVVSYTDSSGNIHTSHDVINTTWHVFRLPLIDSHAKLNYWCQFSIQSSLTVHLLVFFSFYFQNHFNEQINTLTYTFPKWLVYQLLKFDGKRIFWKIQIVFAKKIKTLAQDSSWKKTNS